MATPTKARPAYTWKIEASGWRPQKKGNSLQGFLTLKLPSGMCLYDRTYHRRADGTRWIGLPGRSWKGKDGKTHWVRLIDFGQDQDAHRRFQAQALAAVDERLAKGGAA